MRQGPNFSNPYRSGYQGVQVSSLQSKGAGYENQQQPSSAKSAPKAKAPAKRGQSQPVRQPENQAPATMRPNASKPSMSESPSSDAVGFGVIPNDPRLNKDPDEYGRTDLKGLLSYLDVLVKERVRFTEVTYVVNHWTLYGIIPLKHHGFVLPTRGYGFLSLDFGSRGILWDVDDEFPELPDNTFHAKSYKIDVDPMKLKNYCQRTKPFDWFSNDCGSWANGLLKVLRVHDTKGRKICRSSADLLEDEKPGRRGSDVYDAHEPGQSCGLPLGLSGGEPGCFGGHVPNRRHRNSSYASDIAEEDLIDARYPARMIGA